MNNKKILNQENINNDINLAINHKDDCLNDINKMFEFHLSNQDYKRVHLLSYWFQDFAKYNIYEDNFKPQNLKSYKRGDVIKANLGYNIGNEVGGLHYCIVLDKKNALSSGTLTVVPLTSIKENKAYHSSTVNIGDEIYLSLKNKHTEKHLGFVRKFNELSKSGFLKSNAPTSDNEIKELQQLTSDLNYLNKMNNEISKMKKGSIVLVNQITTISKQRIYTPQNNTDILSGVKISSKSLDLIDNKIKELFLKK